jgi:hypothetical protein
MRNRQRHVRGWTGRERGVLDRARRKCAEIADDYTLEYSAVVSIAGDGVCGGEGADGAHRGKDVSRMRECARPGM